MKVLILDPQWGQTAYLVAELARARFQPVLVSPHPSDPRGLGHYCRQIVSPEINDASYAEFIQRVIEAENPDILLPTSETIYEILWRMQDRFTERVFPRTDARQRLLLTDRREMYRFCESVGVPAPQSMPLSNQEAVSAAASEFGFPLVIRGTRGAAGDQVRIVPDLQSARDAYEDMCRRSPGEPFAQAFVTGNRTLIGGLLDGGRCLQWFSQQTIETHPPVTGPSIRVQSLRDPVLTSYAERLFKNLQWSGLACAEFVRNEAGEFSFLEINPRPWAAIHAAHQCGVPLLRLFAEYLQGRRAAAPIDFPDGKQIALFPQYLAAKVRTRQLYGGRDLGPCWQALRAAPWVHPALLYHFFRQIWWAYDSRT
jgi:carbamoyl-phosphate synthase large subunit